MNKKDFTNDLNEVTIFRQELDENSIDSANASVILAKKLELVGDAFLKGDISRQQALTLYKTYNSAAKAIISAHFIRNQITILPTESHE
jgi:hypothetical protein